MSIKRGILLAVCLALIALCCFQVMRVPSLLQYVIAAPAPASQGENPLAECLRALEDVQAGWEGIVSASAVTGNASRQMLEAVGAGQTEAALTGEYGSPLALPERLYTAGRGFYEEELAGGAPVMILDEQLAIALFRVGDPVGRQVRLGKITYTVVGIARHARAAGDLEAYGAYVPLLSLTEYPLETLTVWAKPVPGSGALAKFRADMAIYAPSGCLYSLSQERERALLPAWLLATVCGLLLLLALCRAFARAVLALRADFLNRLRHRFAAQMAPRLIAYTLLGALMLLALLAAFYGWAQLLLRPVRAFPEWVPAVPVEVSDIMSTYWKNISTLGRLTELRTPQVLTLRMWRHLLRIPCLLAGAVAIHTFGKIWGQRNGRGNGREPSLSEPEREAERAS